MSSLRFAVRFAIIAYLAAAAALYVFQDRMLLPSTLRVAPIQPGRYANFDVQRWLPRGQYAGYVVEPTNGPPSAGTVVIYHGNAETAENKLPLATVFVRAGYRVLLVEYPGHGDREGSRTMKTALAASRSALTDAKAQWTRPIFLVGESLGAGMAARTIAGAESNVDGVLLITPWDSLASLAAEKLRWFPVRWMLHDPFDSVDALKQFERPIVVIGAANDAAIPVWHAERLVRLHPHARFLLLPGADHDSWFDSMTTELWGKALGWMQD